MAERPSSVREAEEELDSKRLQAPSPPERLRSRSTRFLTWVWLPREPGTPARHAPPPAAPPTDRPTPRSRTADRVADQRTGSVRRRRAAHRLDSPRPSRPSLSQSRCDRWRDCGSSTRRVSSPDPWPPGSSLSSVIARNPTRKGTREQPTQPHRGAHGSSRRPRGTIRRGHREAESPREEERNVAHDARGPCVRLRSAHRRSPRRDPDRPAAATSCAPGSTPPNSTGWTKRPWCWTELGNLPMTSPRHPGTSCTGCDVSSVKRSVTTLLSTR